MRGGDKGSNEARVRFLDPIFVDSSMVLNTGGYLFGGVSFEQESEEHKEGTKGASIGIPWLASFLSLSGEVRASSAVTQREVRNVTLGALHMKVVDELRERNALEALHVRMAAGPQWDRAKFVEASVRLQPMDHLALLDAVKGLVPILSELLRTETPIGRRLATALEGRFLATSRAQKSPVSQSSEAVMSWEAPIGPAAGSKEPETLEDFMKAIGDLAAKLEADIQSTGQLEMLMRSPVDNRPLGVVALNLLQDENPKALQSKLAHSEVVIFGKQTRFTRDDSRLPLMESLSVYRAIVILTDMIARLSPYAAGSNAGLLSDLAGAQEKLGTIVAIDIPGPALRLNAMSVCV
jgi:hypothetical protein